jgi:signal transduction histidine kinase
MRLLARELRVSTERMSTLLAAVKSYAYMDQGVQWTLTDLHEGLDNTLIMLQYKIRRKRAEVTKQYDPNLPKVMAYGSELNQVWTNLLDNAIDAVADGGNITIQTGPDPELPDCVRVEIIDNGAGIPPSVQEQIFEPFFTTKAIGKGTGLGLEIAHRIVVSQHRGSIEVDSRPGYTSFKVCLPVGE